MRPLSGERRREIEADPAKYARHYGLSQMVADLLASEGYWRSRVQRAGHYGINGKCLWCLKGNAATFVDCEADCAWVRAQE